MWVWLSCGVLPLKKLSFPHPDETGRKSSSTFELFVCLLPCTQLQSCNSHSYDPGVTLHDLTLEVATFMQISPIKSPSCTLVASVLWSVVGSLPEVSKHLFTSLQEQCHTTAPKIGGQLKEKGDTGVWEEWVFRCSQPFQTF